MSAAPLSLLPFPLNTMSLHSSMGAQLAEPLLSNPDSAGFNSQQGHRNDPYIAASVLAHMHELRVLRLN